MIIIKIEVTVIFSILFFANITNIKFKIRWKILIPLLIAFLNQILQIYTNLYKFDDKILN